MGSVKRTYKNKQVLSFETYTGSRINLLLYPEYGDYASESLSIKEAEKVVKLLTKAIKQAKKNRKKN